ncbi:hypothetical protein NGM10_04045 [Halorussus salilacus]|uniref:DUF7285 family protein n=1 Tax=Halorussus salilacus TaxID=2953750 RepID=UPI00209E7BAF|nr:hypothetical protein [Halorussus salilacus]USZ68912.1 hypothetical protein NGM10_04045 [Halorussus salilacus]
MSPSSGRAQVEPLAALVAVFAVGLAVSAYAGVLDSALPTPDRNLADPTVERAERAVTDAGVVAPDELAGGLDAGPDGYRLNLTLVAGDRTWHAGPRAPPTVDSAAASDAAEVTVSVRVAPGRVRPGRLRAEVWP